VGGMDEGESNGRLANETIGSACGGEGVGGWGTSYVARWPCK
jgi:hypothetical protein